MDLLVINPGGRGITYQVLHDSDLTAYETPIWGGLLTNFALNKGFDADILDTNVLELAPVEAAKVVKEKNPKLVALVVYGHNPSASTQTMEPALATINAIKDLLPDQKIIIIGGHVSALPFKTLKEERVDFVCSGEGPYTLEGLLNVLKQDSYTDDDLLKVKGLVFEYKGKALKTDPAPLVEDLDNEMPGLPWHLIPVEKYRAHNWHGFGLDSRQPYAAIYTTLGCPFQCNFCCIQAPFRDGESLMDMPKNRNSYRYWSPEFILKEIDIMVKEYGIKHIKFADEIFIMNRKHVNDICDGLIERNYDLNIYIHSRVDTLSENLIMKFKKAGIRWVCIGIETANSVVQETANKKIKDNAIETQVERLKKHGINIIGNFVFGLPDDNVERMQETLDLAMALELDYINFTSGMAYPGSTLYQKALDQGIPLPETWGGYAQLAYETFPMHTGLVDGATVLNFRDQAYITYFHDPKYLERIEKKFGKSTREHVDRMNKVRLKRRILGD